jgi:hypothetical protein
MSNLYIGRTKKVTHSSLLSPFLFRCLHLVNSTRAPDSHHRPDVPAPPPTGTPRCPATGHVHDSGALPQTDRELAGNVLSCAALVPRRQSGAWVCCLRPQQPGNYSHAPPLFSAASELLTQAALFPRRRRAAPTCCLVSPPPASRISIVTVQLRFTRRWLSTHQLPSSPTAQIKRRPNHPPCA